MSVEIRVASIDREVDALVDLNVSVQELHLRSEPDVFRAPAAPEVAAWFSDILSHESWHALLAEEAGQALGYVLYEVVDRPEGTFTKAMRTVYVHQIGVTAESRRRGVGRRLLERVEQEAAELGVDQVGLDTWTFNEDAVAFFRQAGYEPYRLQLRKPASDL